MLSFYRYDKLSGNYDDALTGTGKSFEVYGTVINFVKDYVKHHNIPFIIFKAKEPNRKSLYTTVTNNFVKNNLLLTHSI